jgi:hypothetical protein
LPENHQAEREGRIDKNTYPDTQALPLNSGVSRDKIVDAVYGIFRSGRMQGAAAVKNIIKHAVISKNFISLFPADLLGSFVNLYTVG